MEVNGGGRRLWVRSDGNCGGRGEKRKQGKKETQREKTEEMKEKERMRV